jgi:hypothetical protein
MTATTRIAVVAVITFGFPLRFEEAALSAASVVA